MNKTLSRRLDRLTERVLPSGPPRMIRVVYVSPNGVEENGALIDVGGRGPRPACAAGGRSGLA